MDLLWAPWRIKYIQRLRKDKECIFCRALKSRLPKKHYLLLKTRYSLVMMNIFPYNNGHLMVIPKRHIKSLAELNEQEAMDLLMTAKKMVSILKKIIKPAGFNLGMNVGKHAGAGIDGHLHLHIVPRWRGDTNFMPVCGETKIISQSLDELYDKIKNEINKPGLSKK